MLGLANFMLMLALNKYLTYAESYANLPNTLIGSARIVAEGLIGIMPMVIGIAYLGST